MALCSVAQWELIFSTLNVKEKLTQIIPAVTMNTFLRCIITKKNVSLFLSHLDMEIYLDHDGSMFYPNDNVSICLCF